MKEDLPKEKDPVPEENGQDKSPNNPNSLSEPDEPQVSNEASPSEKPHSPNRSKKKLLLVGAGILLVLTLAVAGYYFLTKQDPPQQEASTEQPTPTQFAFKAKAVYVTGSVFKNVGDRKVEIKQDDVLSEGDEIETSFDGKLVLALDEGSVVRIAGNSKVILSTLSPSMISINEDKGIVFARVETDEQHGFEVIAGDVTVSSQGTAFSVENNEDVEVLVFEHKVKVKTQEQEQEVNKEEQWNKERNEVKTMEKERLAEHEFYKWSLEEEKLAAVIPEPTATPKPTAVPTKKEVKQEDLSGYEIKLKAISTDSGIQFKWDTKIDAPNGFKIVKNTEGNPVYPGDDFKYLNDANARSHHWELQDGNTYHFRVCQYLGGKCGIYSNEVVVTAPGEGGSGQESKVNSITLKALKVEDNKARLNWLVDGNSPKGFKVVWSKSENPTYPNRNGDWNLYISNPDARQEHIGGLEAGQTYHFRVCEYLGSSCGIYSNDVSVQM